MSSPQPIRPFVLPNTREKLISLNRQKDLAERCREIQNLSQRVEELKREIIREWHMGGNLEAPEYIRIVGEWVGGELHYRIEIP